MGRVWDKKAVFLEHNPQNYSEFVEYNPQNWNLSKNDNYLDWLSQTNN